MFANSIDLNVNEFDSFRFDEDSIQQEQQQGIH